MTIVSSQNWQIGDNGDVHWDSNCRYVGDAFDSETMSSDKCGGFCLSNLECTHFSHGDGVCTRYNAPNGKQENVGTAGWMCGYVPPRVVNAIQIGVSFRRHWQIGDSGLSRWDFSCDFTGRDIDSKSSSGEQCGGICISNSQCTHFTFGNGICWMKRNTNQWFESNSPGAVCGFIPGRFR